MIGLIICLRKNFSDADQWRVEIDKDEEKKKLGNKPFSYLSPKAQCPEVRPR